MVYLVDFENTGVSGLDGISKLPSNDVVVIFYTAQNSKIPMEVLSDIHCTVKYHKIPSGKQAVDVCIYTYLGYVIGCMKEENFTIVSADNGYSTAVGFMKTIEKNISVDFVTRISGGFSEQTGENKTSKNHILFVLKTAGVSGVDINNIEKILSAKECSKGEHKNQVYTYLTDALGQKKGLKIYNVVKPYI